MTKISKYLTLSLFGVLQSFSHAGRTDLEKEGTAPSIAPALIKAANGLRVMGRIFEDGGMHAFRKDGKPSKARPTKMPSDKSTIKASRTFTPTLAGIPEDPEDKDPLASISKEETSKD